jgi:hypothetical protein
VLRTHYVQFLEEHTGQLQRAPPWHTQATLLRKWTDSQPPEPRVCVRMCVCVQVKGKNSGNRGLGKGGPGAWMQIQKQKVKTGSLRILRNSGIM